MALCGQKGSNQKAANTEAENNPCSSAVRYWQYFIKTLQGAKGVKCIDAGKEQKDSSAGALYPGPIIFVYIIRQTKIYNRKGHRGVMLLKSHKTVRHQPHDDVQNQINNKSRKDHSIGKLKHNVFLLSLLHSNTVVFQRHPPSPPHTGKEKSKHTLFILYYTIFSCCLAIFWQKR